jgi:hypothetical protein
MYSFPELTVLSACLLPDSSCVSHLNLQIERQFLAQVEYAEELPCTVGQIPGM